ncbi:MAG: hypothetical protein KDD50_13850 [Bdellovibrionales bacterium]|nr:hypothetical protein [Bdellovibrionales bacterium]
MTFSKLLKIIATVIFIQFSLVTPSVAKNQCLSLFSDTPLIYKLKKVAGPRGNLSQKSIIHMDVDALSQHSFSFSSFENLSPKTSAVRIDTNENIQLWITNGPRSVQDPIVREIFEEYLKLLRKELSERTHLTDDQVNTLIHRSRTKQNALFFIVTIKNKDTQLPEHVLSGLGSFYVRQGQHHSVPLEEVSDYRQAIDHYTQQQDFIELGKYVKNRYRPSADNVSSQLYLIAKDFFTIDPNPILRFVLETNYTRARLYKMMIPEFKTVLELNEDHVLLYGEASEN